MWPCSVLLVIETCFKDFLNRRMFQRFLDVYIQVLLKILNTYLDLKNLSKLILCNDDVVFIFVIRSTGQSLCTHLCLPHMPQNKILLSIYDSQEPNAISLATVPILILFNSGHAVMCPAFIFISIHYCPF